VLGQGRRIITGLLLLCVAMPGSATAAAASVSPAPPLEAARRDYGEAVQALERRRWDDFSQLRSSLDAYPLAIYLDYYELTRQAHKVRAPRAQRFLERSDDTPLPNRFLAVYLREAGKRRRWDDFLAVMPDEPNSVVLKCYYFRALLARGERDAAWEGAGRLWVHGKSRPEECDPLFDAWQASGELSDDIVWARLLEAFDERQRSLMRYVASKGSEQLQPWSERLLKVYASPVALGRLSLPASESRSADVAAHGLAHLSRYNPQEALLLWRDFSQRLAFSPAQVREVEYAIALRSLFAETDAHRDWLHGALQRLADDKLTGIRLRWALAEQDWSALERTLPLLSAEQQEAGVWRYWRAVALQRRGETEQAQALLQALAQERGYYSFLAADRLGLAYAFNHTPLAPLPPATLQGLPALQRIEELHFHDEDVLAHSEWYKVLQDTEDPQEQRKLARLAADQGWYRMAIDAATRAKAWDALDIRFPIPYRSVFDAQASAQQVASTELLAIARRESAFFPRAQSPVGARGLMQVMPATGRQVASSIGARHSGADLYDVEQNVLLGSTYYRQLLDRYGGNRVFALTAYNAGPHRVDRWRNGAGDSVSVELWIETIPYRETRNYVQAVLAYNVVFAHLMGEQAALLTPLERQAAY